MQNISGTNTAPHPDGHSIVLNGQNEAVCVIRTVRTYTVPFDKVNEEHLHEGRRRRPLTGIPENGMFRTFISA